MGGAKVMTPADLGGASGDFGAASTAGAFGSRAVLLGG